MKQNSKFLFLFLALSLLFACARTPQQLISEKPILPTVDLTSENIREAIVVIERENTSGTGFFVAPDMIATNIHSVARSGSVSVKSLDREKDWTIEGVVGFDAKNSLVILKLTGEGIPLPLGNSDVLGIGESISILDYPDGEYKITDGSIQSIRKRNRWLRLNTTTSKVPNGSPVFNDNGQVIAVIVPYNIGSYSYAVPSSALEILLDKSTPIEPLTEWQKRKHIRAAAFYGLGKQKLDAKDYADAIVNFDRAIELNPKYLRAHYERGRAQAYLGDYESGIASCTQVLEMDPDEADAYYVRGSLKARLGNYGDVIVDLDKAIKLDAQHANAYSNRGGVKFKFGESEAARGNTEAAQRLYKAAIVDCDKAIEIDSEYAYAYNYRGMARLSLDDFEGAILDFNRAIQNDAGDATIYNNRGWAKFKFGESENSHGNTEAAQRLYKAAIEDYTRTIEIDSEHTVAYGNRGLAKFKLGESEVTRANVKEAQNLYKSAIADCDKAIRIDLENAYAYNIRGSAQLHLGAFASDRGDMERAQVLYGKAIEDCTRVIQINPQDADTYHKRGIVKCKLGDIESTRGDAEIAQKLYDDGITDFDNYTRLKYPENVNEPVAAAASERVINSIVRVVSWDDRFGVGSGFFVDKDKIATNIHVVAQTGPVYVTRRNEETIWKVEEVTAFDVENDLVILKISGEGTSLSLGDSDTLQNDEPVIAVGYPGGGYKVTTGVIDGIRNSGKSVRMKVVLSGGNSGGPALNSKGEVIGVNTAVGEHYAYATPSNALKALIVQSESTEPLEEWRQRDHIRAHAYLIQGQQKYKSDRYREALSYFDISIQLNPAFIDAYRGRGNMHASLSNHEEAITDYNTVIQLNPDDAKTYNNRGDVRFSLGKSESARGKAETAQKLFEEAVEDWTRTIKLASEYTDVYSKRSVARIVLGDFEEAIVDLDKAIQIDPENAKYYYDRGRAKEALGQKEAAKADFQKAKKLDPNVGK